MRKNIIKSLCLSVSLMLIALLSLTSKNVKAEETNTPDWMPFNYVLTEGFGSAMRYNDVRTNVSVDNGKITFSGRTTKGGMGATYLNELNLDGLTLNISVNSWQDVSPDRWFGFTLTDVGVKNDDYNEVPFYSKHSESWSVDYGAGILFAFRPNNNGAMQIQFNFIGINPSLDGDGNPASNAGEYNDGLLGWAGWLSTIQLYNTDWTEKTDYENVKIEMKAIKEADIITGYCLDINDGYWKRTDAVDWDNFAEDVFVQLDADENGVLSADEKENFMYGPAWETSIVPYANWGETFLSLVKYEKMLKENGKRLYLSFMYKDLWDIREDVDDASFTVNSINNGPATTMTSFDLVNDSEVTGNLSATIKEDTFHAGVYPSYVKSLAFVDAAQKSYKSAQSAIDALANGKSYKVVNVKGVLENGNNVEIVNAVNVNMNLSEYANAKLYKIVGEELNEVTDLTKVKVSNSTANYVIVYDAPKGDNKGGCKSVAILSLVSLIAPISFAFIIKRKKEN